MSDSILERVISRKEDQDKQSFDAVEIVQQLLKQLTSKEADILRRRHGLRPEGRETLEMIGSAYQVTRERIRQIERQSIDQLRATEASQEILLSAERLVVSLLHTHGGVLEESMMYEVLLGVHHTSEIYTRSLLFLLNELMTEKIEAIKPSQYFMPGWKLCTTSLAFVSEVIDQLVLTMKQRNEPATMSDILEAFTHTELYAAHPILFSDAVLTSYVALSKQMGKNPFDEYGLVSWGSISPKRMNDRVYVVLKKEGKPLHFEEIAQRISKIFKKKAYAPTVHNELILNDQYVLVGRGMYALKEWGYSEGVVAEVLADILRSAKKPMSKHDLVAQVLEQRMVKKNTILLALADKTLFQKNANGLYTIVEHTPSLPESSLLPL